jgi:hypothetical protein
MNSTVAPSAFFLAPPNFGGIVRISFPPAFERDTLSSNGLRRSIIREFLGAAERYFGSRWVVDKAIVYHMVGGVDPVTQYPESILTV